MQNIIFMPIGWHMSSELPCGLNLKTKKQNKTLKHSDRRSKPGMVPKEEALLFWSESETLSFSYRQKTKKNLKSVSISGSGISTLLSFWYLIKPHIISIIAGAEVSFKLLILNF